MTRTKSTFLALVAVLLAPMVASADIIEYSFEADGGVFGNFIYDDTAVSVGNGPFSLGGAAYEALSFFINGSEIFDALLVIYDDFSGSDFAYFTTVSGDPYLQLSNSGSSLFTGNDAAQMNGLSLSDFDGRSNGENGITTVDGFRQLTSLNSTTVSVPEPGTLALFGIGLFGMGLARRKKA